MKDKFGQGCNCQHPDHHGFRSHMFFTLQTFRRITHYTTTLVVIICLEMSNKLLCFLHYSTKKKASAPLPQVARTTQACPTNIFSQFFFLDQTFATLYHFERTCRDGKFECLQTFDTKTMFSLSLVISLPSFFIRQQNSS